MFQHEPTPKQPASEFDRVGAQIRAFFLSISRSRASFSLRYLKRGILFYWYTGERRIAFTGASVTTILYLFCLWMLGATSLFALVLMLLMDHLLIIFMLLYVIAVRPLFPGFLIGELDAFVASYWLYIFAGWIGSRVITNAIASRFFGFKI